MANHASHIDTPVILAALPRRFRKRTAVAAAADYFYRNRMVAALVSLIFNTVPLDRDGGGVGKQATEHLDKLLDQGWNLLLYPGGHALTQRRARPGAARRRGAGGAPQAPRDPDPRERHERGDAARALLAQAAARQDHVEAPQGRDLLRRPDHAEQGLRPR